MVRVRLEEAEKVRANRQKCCSLVFVTVYFELYGSLLSLLSLNIFEYILIIVRINLLAFATDCYCSLLVLCVKVFISRMQILWDNYQISFSSLGISLKSLLMSL